MADDSKSVGSPPEALRWLTKAEDDLAVANIVVDAPAGVNWTACFHAQQATEKALKAVLVAYGIDFPRSHALERLVALMPAGPAASFDFEAVAELTPWAVARWTFRTDRATQYVSASLRRDQHQMGSACSGPTLARPLKLTASATYRRCG